MGRGRGSNKLLYKEAAPRSEHLVIVCTNLTSNAVIFKNFQKDCRDIYVSSNRFLQRLKTILMLTGIKHSLLHDYMYFKF